MPDDQTRILLDAAEQAGILGHGKTSTVTLYKCVGENMCSQGGHRDFKYEVGEIAVAPDYDPSPRCGNGLHFWPTIEMAKNARWSYGHIVLECEVDLASLIPIGDKCKSRSARVVRIVENGYEQEAEAA